MIYPPSGSFCWSPLGHLAIIHNPRLDIVRNVPEESLGKKKIMDKSDLENYFRSLKRSYKCEDYQNFNQTKEFFLSDSVEEKEFHLKFENETLNYEEDDEDALENLDFLNFSVVNETGDRNEKDEKMADNEISLKAQKVKSEEYEQFDLRQKPDLKTKFLKLFRKNAPSKLI